MDVRYVLTGARTIQALIGGSVQFAQGVSSRTVPSAVLGGADAILVANFVEKLLFTMHGAPEINSMQDLKGKVVGVSGIGGSTDFAARLALREAGLVPDKDVAIRGVGGVAETVAAMKAKVVHAGTLSPPSSFVAQKAGFKILFDMSTLGVDYVSSGLGVKKTTIISNREQVKQFLMGMIEGAKILRTDEESSLRALAKHTRIADREVLRQSYTYMKPYFLKAPYPSFRSIKDTLDILAKEMPKAKDANPRDFFDNSILKEIEASGYIEALYAR
jgi:NitT/TauT family transport system substrate-binding protein